MRRALEALRIDLIDVLRTRRPGREPPATRHDLQAVDRRVVARRAGQLGGDRLAGEGVFLDRGRRQLLESRLLLGRGGRVDARVVRRAELRHDLFEVLAGILAGARRDLGREEIHDRAVLVGRPYRTVAAQEAGAGALLP